MIVEFVADIAKLALIVAGLHFALGAYARRSKLAWSGPVEKRRLLILSMFVFAVVAVKVTEDVVAGESGPVDEAILRFIHDHVPGTLTGSFEVVTLSGSAKVLFPLTIAATLALLVARRWFEALLLSASVIGSATVVYVVKTLSGRTRPALWETQWYWGSSFPSGHTLVVAGFATAGVLCVSRIWPRARESALAAAVSWISLVALSRLVLGVHWPTDVLAAACTGAFLPLAISVALEVRCPAPNVTR